MRLLPGVLIFCLMLAGCSGSGGLPSPPDYDPDALAKAALAQFDKNGNGTIEGSELDACPALKQRATFEAIDKNKDKALSANELAERFRMYRETGVSVVSLDCTVRLNGQPLEGAMVTFTPEAFLAGTIKPGSGTSDASGAVSITSPDGPGLTFGLYRVTVSKKNAAGAETLPAKYNTATTLGRELAPDRGATAVNLDLTAP